MKLFLVLTICATVSYVHSRRTAEEWRDRKIYQLLTDRFAGENSETWNQCYDMTGYCSGNFKGLIQYLDYIVDLGFNAIWISPVPEHVEGDYHGYSATNYYSVSHHWGTEQDFHDLISEAHAKDVWIMVDVVPNHMGIDVYGEVPTEWYPFNKTEHYHNFCEINDWNDPSQVENCWLFGLPDLAQENDFVNQGLGEWIDWLLDTFDIDGLRIDTVKHVEHSFWYDWVEASGDVYEVGEVYDGSVNKMLEYVPPLDAILNYPQFYEMMNVFQNGYSMRSIASKYEEMKSNFGDSLHIQGPFVDNHDRPRFLCGSDSWAKLKNYIALTLTMEGIPIFYYGTEQGYAGCDDPANRESLYPNFNENHELYQFVATTNYYVKQMGDDFIYSDQIERWIDDDLYAFTRGETLVVATDIGEFNDLSRTVTYHNYEVGTVLVNIYWPDDDRITVESSGIPIYLLGGETKIFIPEDIFDTIPRRT